MEGASSEGVTAKHITAMKLSTEAIVAAAVAVAFAVLSLGAIAREQSERGPNAPNAYVANSLSESGDNQVLGFY
jgi:hypothetical protein